MPMDKRELISELIVLRCQRGDPDGFQQLVQEWERPLIYYIRRMLGSDRDWDVLQEVWLQAFRGIGSIREPKMLSAWLFRIAHHLVMRQLREKYVDPLAGRTDLTDFNAVIVDDVSFDAEDAEQLHQAMQQLPVAFREVLTLHFLEAMPIQSIADMLDVPSGTIKSRIYHAKRALRAELERKVLR